MVDEIQNDNTIEEPKENTEVISADTTVVDAAQENVTEAEQDTDKPPQKRLQYVKPTAETLQSALIVIDMQNDFVKGALGNNETKAVIENVVNRVKEYVAAEKPVIFTRDTHFGDYLETQEGVKLPTVHCIKDSDGWQIIEELSQFASTVIDKPTFGSFVLVNSCVEKHYSGVEIVGVCTDICVVSNAILLKAALPDSVIAVNADCTAGTTKSAAANAINVMRKCQIDII